MSLQSRHFTSRALIIIGIGVLLPWLSYALQGHLGLSLWDEGFLWYGAQRVMEGEIPLRDFQSYDIGRYYWSAGVMDLLGSKGVLALRISNSLLQSLAMAMALGLLNWKASRLSILEILLVAFSMVLWMSPSFKAADFLATLSLLYVLAHLIHTPDAKRYFLCGFVVGLSAIVGRNHGVYGLVGSVGAFAYLRRRGDGVVLKHSTAMWTLGIAVGYLPMILMLLLTPGFASAMVASIQAIFEYGSTNLPLPLPLFWEAPFNQSAWLESLSEICMGMLFAILPIIGTVSIALLVRNRGGTTDTAKNPVFIASALLMVPYAHYAFSRADLTHLALGIFPFIIGILVLAGNMAAISRHIVVALLVVFSALVCLPSQLYFQMVYLHPKLETIELMGDQLELPSLSAFEINLLKDLCEQLAPNGRPFLALPFWPGAYAAMGRKSPTWEIYAALPKSESFQQAEIARLRVADVGFVILTDYLLDGREDYLYRNSHPLVERYVRTSFQELTDSAAPPPTLRIFATKQK